MTSPRMQQLVIQKLAERLLGPNSQQAEKHEAYLVSSLQEKCLYVKKAQEPLGVIKVTQTL